jgi:hypothetical protein
LGVLRINFFTLFIFSCIKRFLFTWFVATHRAKTSITARFRYNFFVFFRRFLLLMDIFRIVTSILLFPLNLCVKVVRLNFLFYFSLRKRWCGILIYALFNYGHRSRSHILIIVGFRRFLFFLFIVTVATRTRLAYLLLIIPMLLLDMLTTHIWLHVLLIHLLAMIHIM